jgi:hypothetical protein
MQFVTLALLILLGILGIAALLREKNANLAGPLGQLQAVEGWIGLVGLIWGLIGILHLLSLMGAFSYAPFAFLMGFVTQLVVIALSLILSVPALKTLIGENGFTKGLADLSSKLAPFKAILGVVCLVLAVWTIVRIV